MTVAERRLYTAKGGGNLLSLDYVINTFSGRIKNLKKLKVIENQEKEVNTIKNRFATMITNELPIDSIQLNEFIYYFINDEEYKKNKFSGDFQLTKLLSKKANEFNALKR